MEQTTYRVRPALAGYAWITSGAVLLKNNLVRWNIAMFVFLGLLLFSNILGLPIVIGLLEPVLWAGFYLAGEACVKRQEWTPAILFEPLKMKARSLIILGVLLTLINLTIAFFFIDHLGTIIDLEALQVAMKTVAESGEKTALLVFFNDPVVLQRTLLTILVMLLVSLPFMIAGWFAPILIIKKSYTPVQALIESFKACSANFLSFFVYGLVILAMFFIIVISYFLALFFIGPLFLASYYTSYQDIWPDEEKESHIENFPDDDADSTLTV